MTDPIADMLTRIRNAIGARQTQGRCPGLAPEDRDRAHPQGGRLRHQLQRQDERKGATRGRCAIFLRYGPKGESVISRPRARLPAEPPRLCAGARRFSKVLGGLGHQHPEHFARRDDRQAGAQRPDRRRGLCNVY